MGLLIGFIFFKWVFKKTTGCVFLVGSNYINTEDNYGRIIDFLSQISKLSFFNVLDLADFMMQHWFPVSFFVLVQSHTCVCNMYFLSSFVINWQFKRIDRNGSHTPVSVLYLRNCTYNSYIIKNENFLEYFLRILNSCVV